MRHAVLLLCSVLIGGTYAVAQSTPAAPASPAEALPAPPPLHPLTDAQAREMLKLQGSDRIEKQTMAQELKILPRVFPPYMPKDVMDDLKTSLESIDLDSIIVKIYQEHISEKDAAATIAFYKTTAGQHVLAAMPVMMAESREAGIEAGRKVTLEVLTRHKAEILAAAQKYKDEHWIPPAQPQH